jgi:SAM-dependent methyltransferase
MAGLLDPFFLTTRALRREIAAVAPAFSGRVLDIGCGSQPYRACFGDVDYIGIEVSQASVHGSAKRADTYFDGLNIPLRDGSVQHVLCTQVLEHVFQPDQFLEDVRRVLAPGGSMLLTVPFLWDEHEQPYDYARYSSFGLRHLAKVHGFEVALARRTMADASLFAQLWLAYLFKVTKPAPAWLRKPFLAAVSLPANVAGMAMGWLLPANPDLYLDNVMVWTKQPRDGRSDERS